MELQLKNNEIPNVYYYVTTRVVNKEPLFIVERLFWDEEKEENIIEQSQDFNLLDFTEEYNWLKINGWEICS